jgi:hypothetical protein
MRQASEFLPWKVTDISIRPVEGFWSMNPSLHFDGTTWRCLIRCTDYAMPNGRTVRSSKSRPAGNQTKNAMVIFDPASWKPVSIHLVEERDAFPRVRSANLGFEDVRIFKTKQGGLQGIGASLHLQRAARSTVAGMGTGGAAQHQPPEQVLLSFDTEYNIIHAHPIRGDWWSGTPQKNWVPYDNCEEPRFLYSIGRGTMFAPTGVLRGEEALVTASARAVFQAGVPETIQTIDQPSLPPTSIPAPAPPPPLASRLGARRGADVVVRGRRAVHDVTQTRPSRGANAPPVVIGNQRVMGTGRALPPRYEGLRGGSQLVQVEADSWLGIAHEMRFHQGLKFYWHTWYLTDARGRLKATSEAMKLAPNGIEFAAGLVVDGDRVVVSYGVDDMEAKIGETSLTAVMGLLQKGLR